MKFVMTPRFTYAVNIYLEQRTSEPTRSFTFYLSSTTVTTLTQSIPLYGAWDYIYEIGGWIGLFLGYSVIDLFDELVDLVIFIRAYLAQFNR